MKKTGRIGVLAGVAIAVFVAAFLVNFSKGNLAQSLNSILQGNDSGAETLYKYWQLKNAPEPGQYEDKLVGGKMLFQCKVGEAYPAYFGYLVIKEAFSLGFPTPDSKPYIVYISAIDYGDHSSVAIGPQEENGAGPLSELRVRGCEVPSDIANAPPPVANSGLAPQNDSGAQSNAGEQNTANDIPGNAAKTRFGIFQVQIDEQGKLQGKIYSDTSMLVKSDSISEATIKSKFEAGDADLLLVEHTQGTSCPATYTFFTVTANAVSASPEFGTCAEVSEVKPNGNTIRLAMPGFKGPFESPESQAAAANERHVFVFHDGVVKDQSVDAPTKSTGERRTDGFSIVGAWNCGNWTSAFFPDGTTLTRTHMSDGEPAMDIAGNYSYSGDSMVLHERYSRFVTADYTRRLSDQWQAAARSDDAFESNDAYSEDIISEASEQSFRMTEVRVENWNHRSVRERKDPLPVECRAASNDYAELAAAKSSLPYDLAQ